MSGEGGRVGSEEKMAKGSNHHHPGAKSIALFELP